MKTKGLFLSVLFLFALQLFYGQEIKNKTIFGKQYFKSTNTTFKQKSDQPLACKTIASFGCRDIPTGLAWDKTNFWLVDTGYIYKVSREGIYLDSIPNPATMITFLQGGDLAYDGSYLWYADEQSSQLFKINPATKSVEQHFDLPASTSGDPNGFSITWDGDYLWHCTYEPPVLYKLNPVNGKPLTSVAMDKEILILEWVKGTLYGLGNSMFYTINAATGTATDSVEWCVPLAFGLTWDGNAFWNVSGPPEIFGFPTGGLKKVFKLNADVNISVDENIDKQGVTVFPNPASDNILIHGNHISQIEIFDVTGNLVYNKTRIRQSGPLEISVSAFPKGIYFTRVYDESGISTKKLIVR